MRGLKNDKVKKKLNLTRTVRFQRKGRAPAYKKVATSLARTKEKGVIEKEAQRTSKSRKKGI